MIRDLDFPVMGSTELTIVSESSRGPSDCNRRTTTRFFPVSWFVELSVIPEAAHRRLLLPLIDSNPASFPATALMSLLSSQLRTLLLRREIELVFRVITTFQYFCFFLFITDISI